MAGAVLTDSDSGRSRSGYYLAVALFVAILAFAVLGLVRSSSLVGQASHDPGKTPLPAPTRTAVAALPAPTAQIPPPTPSEPTRPPSMTHLYPPPEASATAVPEAGDQPRR
jgi:hypothetical protein